MTSDWKVKCQQHQVGKLKVKTTSSCKFKGQQHQDEKLKVNDIWLKN